MIDILLLVNNGIERTSGKRQRHSLVDLFSGHQQHILNGVRLYSH